MSEVLAKFPVEASRGIWLILECGHWYKWTGSDEPPDDLPCPVDEPITVKKGVNK